MSAKMAFKTRKSAISSCSDSRDSISRPVVAKLHWSDAQSFCFDNCCDSLKWSESSIGSSSLDGRPYSR